MDSLALRETQLKELKESKETQHKGSKETPLKGHTAQRKHRSKGDVQ